MWRARAEKEIKCAGISLVIKEAKYTANEVNITGTYDVGTQDLINLTFEVIEDGHVFSNSTTLSLSPGESFVGTVNTTGGGTVPVLVRVRALCLEEIPIVGECKSGEPCMKAA